MSFDDNKEGVFGVRVTRAMELPSKKPAIFVDAQGNPTEVKVLDNTGVNGNYLSSRGLEGNEVWGTRSEWVKLYSIIDEEPVSITIIDHPNNVGYQHIGMQEIMVYFQQIHWVKKYFLKVVKF